MSAQLLPACVSRDSADGTSEPAFPKHRHVLEAECDRCGALRACRERISWGTGPLDASIVVVGEAPGYGTPEADCWRGGNWTGMAYTSRHSGRRIRTMLARMGYDDAYYTNAVKCFPASEAPRASESASGEIASDPKDPSTNREPTTAERANCREHLLAELETVDPAVVLATGKHATTTVLEADGRSLDDLDGSGFLDCVLEPIRCETLAATLLAILHPSYQDVWIGRLGYEPAAYCEEIRATLNELVD